MDYDCIDLGPCIVELFNSLNVVRRRNIGWLIRIRMRKRGSGERKCGEHRVMSFHDLDNDSGSRGRKRVFHRSGLTHLNIGCAVAT